MTLNETGRSSSGVVVLLAVGALIILALAMRGCAFGLPSLSMYDGQSLMGRWNWIGHYGLFGIGGLIQIGLAVWVGFDAEKRGMNGWLWGLLVFFTFIVGLLVYLIVGQSMGNRPEGGTFARFESAIGRATTAATSAATAATTAAAGVVSASGIKTGPTPDVAPARPADSPTCPSCSADVRADFKVCPHCGNSLRCRECNEPLRGGWKLCPQCGTAIPKAPGSAD